MQLSLAIAAKGRCHLDGCFEALRAEGLINRPDVDIQIVHDEPLTPSGVEPARNLYLHAVPSGTSITKLWGTAIARSQGDYVAVLDVHCPPQPEWFTRVQTEMDKGTALFFGPVEPGCTMDDKEIVGYLTSYAPFKAPLSPRLQEVPGNNLVIRRDLLGAAETLESTGFFKTFTIWRIVQERGSWPSGYNDMRVRYHKPFVLQDYLARQYIRGRCFAALRHDQPGQPPRLACIAYSPLLPWVRTWRVWRVVRDRTSLRKAFRRFFHFVLLSEVVWSLGEFVGYAFGGRNCCDRLE